MENQVIKIENPLLDPSQIKIDQVESEMLKQEQIECSVVHRFGPGIYMREVTMPAGAMVVGHHQNLEHMNFFVKGKMTLLMDGMLSEICAPMTFSAKPGRKVAQIHEESVWINVYPNPENEQNVEALEAKLLTKSENFVLTEEKRNTILLGNRKWDNSDYYDALKELGLYDNQLCFREVIPLPFEGFKIKTAKSRIHGEGLFATAEISYGETIGPVKRGSSMTMLGKFINHSRYPNAKFVKGALDGAIDLVAVEKIFGCRGGFDGDEITVDYRDAFKLVSENLGGLKWQE